MREALSLDGVLFLDAAVGISDRLSDTASVTTTGESSDSDGSLASDMENLSLPNPRPRRRSAANPSGLCRLLGRSLGGKPDSELDVHDPSLSQVTESLLRGLLRRHPYGKIWAFDERGVLYAHDNETTGHHEAPEASYRSRDQWRAARNRASHHGTASDGERTQQVLPGARSVALHGMWDSVRRRWSDGCLLWSYGDLRSISVDTDLNFVAAFSDVVLADTKRTQSEFSDKAKSTFISSVSHELRSPLHGILGSAEVLQEYSMDPTALSLVQQIETCGQNLLDIIDHILDFAKLRN